MEIGIASNRVSQVQSSPVDGIGTTEETLLARRERKELIDLQGDSQQSWVELDNKQFLRIDSPRREVGESSAGTSPVDLPLPPGNLIAAPIFRLLASLAGEKTSLDTTDSSELNRIAAIRALELVELHQELWLNHLKNQPRQTHRGTAP